MPRLLLASTSPRRRMLCAELGVDFELCPPGPEPVGEGSPAELALLRAKAKASGAQVEGPGLVLGVDTVVDLSGAELGKPRDRTHAREMLQRLSGQVHLVHSGHCLFEPGVGVSRLALSSAEVRFAPLTRAVLEAYLQTDAWQGKAGAYGIQDEACGFATLVAGERSTVVGMDLPLIQRWLAERGDA